jgi:hypothetical protein
MKNYLRVDDDDDDETISDIIGAARERIEDLTSRCLMRQQWKFALDRFPSLYTDYTFGDDYLSVSRPRRYSVYMRGKNEIILPRAPLISVDSISYLDGTGQRQTLPTSAYTVDDLSEPTRIRPAASQSWPAHMTDVNSIVITFTTGYELSVTEQKTIPTNSAVVLDRAADALALVSVMDGETPVANCTLNAGLVTVPSSENGKTVSITYSIKSVPKTLMQAMRLLCAAWYDNRAEVVQGDGNFNRMPTPLSVQSLAASYDLFAVGFPQG